MFKFQCWALFVFSIFAVVGLASDTSSFDSDSALGLVYALMVIGVTAYVLFVQLKGMADLKKDNASLKADLMEAKLRRADDVGVVTMLQMDRMYQHALDNASSPVVLPSVKTRAPKKGKK